jgi:ankyrin repeat protein
MTRKQRLALAAVLFGPPLAAFFYYQGALFRTDLGEELILQVGARNRPAVESLLKRNADINASVRGRTPLIAALENDDAEMTKLLLDRGADPKVENASEKALSDRTRKLLADAKARSGAGNRNP